MNYSELSEEIEKIVRLAGDALLGIGHGKVSEKSGSSDLVTEWDVKTQRFLFEKLSALCPNAVFIGEEEGHYGTLPDEECFIIDPIDGTTNFVFGCRLSAISVGYVYHRKAVIGVVYNPWMNELFRAVDGQGAYLNGTRLMPPDRMLCQGPISFGSAPYFEKLRHLTPVLLGDLCDRVMDFRRFGSAAIDLCYCALGRVIGFFELRLNYWDYCAALVIAREAGCVITNEKGEHVTPEMRQSVVICGVPSAQKELLQVIQNRVGDSEL